KQALVLKPGDQSVASLSCRIQEAKEKKSQFDAVVAAARRALAKELLNEAEDQVQRALQLLPEAPSARELLGHVQKRRHLQAEYEQLIVQVRELLRTEEFSKAKDLARQAVRLKPQDPSARQLLADARQERRAQVGLDTTVLSARQAFELGDL